MIRQTVVDGVPTLIAPTSGPTRAGLMFRVGQADETLARRGITHLLEHLALYRIDGADHHYNGATGQVVTFFHTDGTPENVAAFLTQVCASLRDLPTARLETEKEILRTEQSGRGNPAAAAIPLWRHGARDHGLTGFPEWGLHAVTAADLRDWSSRYFTRDNAVLWIAGDGVPPDLRLDLPEGAPRPVPAASSALPVTPAWFPGDGPVTAVELVVPRSVAAGVYTAVLERRLYRELRQEAGLSYTAAAAYEPRGDGHATITAIADALPAKQEAVLGGVVDVLAALRRGRITDADVAAAVAKRLAALRGDDVDADLLPGAAFALLTGAPVEDRDDLARAVEKVTTDEVRAVAAEAAGTALLMTPDGCTADWAGYAAAPTGSPAVVTGTTHRRRTGAPCRLIVGDAGISVVYDDGDPATVHWADCVAMLTWPDGGRRLIGPDAVTVAFEPTFYEGTEHLAIDHRVPPDRHIPMPARTVPVDESRPAPAPAPVADRPLTRRSTLLGVLAAVLGTLTVVAAVAAAGGIRVPIGVIVIGVVCFAGVLKSAMTSAGNDA